MPKEEKKKEFKELFFIHQYVNGDHFEKVGDYDSLKIAWEILEKAYAWDDKRKMVRLKTHTCQLELIQIEEKETINDFTTWITRLVNQVKACGETCKNKFGSTSTYIYVLMITKCRRTILYTNCLLSVQILKDQNKI